MFDSLLKELDTLGVEEQKSACIWALELCALELEELSCHDMTMPISPKQEALMQLVNQLVFRLYGINPTEATQMQAELRNWHT